MSKLRYTLPPTGLEALMWHMWRAVTEKLVVLLDVERAGVKLSSAFGAVCQTDLDFLV